jgi:hypothetical protein
LWSGDTVKETMNRLLDNKLIRDNQHGSYQENPEQRIWYLSKIFRLNTFISGLVLLWPVGGCAVPDP